MATPFTFGRSAYRRNRGNLPELSVVNMFAERAPTEQEGVVLQSRKGIGPLTTVGPGPIRGVFQEDGIFGGARFVVSGGNLYRDALLVGAISGTGPVYMAGIAGEVIVAAGANIHSYRAVGLATVSFPDGAAVTAVAYAQGYFIALRKDTGRWYFSSPYDGRAWDGLDFATAESSPDRLLDIIILDGNPVLFGSGSVEFLSSTGDPDIPFTVLQQRTFEQGIADTGCAVQLDNTFYFVGSDRILYRNGTVPDAVGDEGLVERLVNTTALRLYKMSDERHQFVMLRGDDFTMGYDVTTGETSEFQSFGRPNFRVGPFMGDDETGTIWQWSGWNDNGDALERRFRAGALLGGPMTIDRLRLTSEVGTTSFLTGNFVDPSVEMRISDDAGSTWSLWEPEGLGKQGEYRRRVEWRALGMFDEPGVLAEFRVTDPVSWRVSAVVANPTDGGRQR